MTSQKPFQIIYQIQNRPVSEAIKFKSSAIETETVNLTSDSDDEIQLQPESSIHCEEVTVKFNDVEDDKFEVHREQLFETDVERFTSSENLQLPKLMRIEDVRSLQGSKRKADEFLEEVQLPKLIRINPVHFKSGTKASNSSQFNPQKINYNMTIKVEDGNDHFVNESTAQVKSSYKSSTINIQPVLTSSLNHTAPPILIESMSSNSIIKNVIKSSTDDENRELENHDKIQPTPYNNQFSSSNATSNASAHETHLNSNKILSIKQEPSLNIQDDSDCELLIAESPKFIYEKSDESESEFKINRNYDSDENSDRELRIDENFDSNLELVENSMIKSPPKNVSMNRIDFANLPLQVILEEPSSDDSSKKFACNQCNRSFGRKVDLVHHLDIHSDFKFHCETCGHKFKSFNYYKKHQCISCHVCKKYFSSKQARSNHIRNHHMEESEIEYLECDMCERKFKYRHGLIYHIHVEHLKVEATLKCDFCEKKFKMKESLKMHMRLHEDDIHCEICNKALKQINLKHHMKTVHVEERNFPCPTCSLTFKTKVGLKGHIKTHEKKFECSICDKKFAQQSILKEHLEWHKDPHIFTCKYCGKTFNQKNCLKSHQKLHENGVYKKINCTRCTYTTDCEKKLEKHELRHTKQETYKESKKNWIKCEICPLYLKNKLKLASHMWKRHKEALE